MFRFLAAGWLTRRLAGPVSRLIPNPYLRAAAIAGLGVAATRLFQSRRGESAEPQVLRRVRPPRAPALRQP